MTDNLLARLRVMAYQYGLLKERGMSKVDVDSISEAADEIERLRNQVKDLTEDRNYWEHKWANGSG